MAEKNKKTKTPFEKQQEEARATVAAWKLGAESNIVSLIYRHPDLLRETNLTINDFHHNQWRVYFEIARDLILNEKKSVVGETDIGFYLSKHKALREKFTEYGGYKTVEDAGQYIDVRNFDGYVNDIRKWNAVIKMIDMGFPCNKERLSELCDITTEEVYDMYTVYLNDIFANVDNGITTYNGFEGMRELIDELNEGKNVGIPFGGGDITKKEGFYLLNQETGGMLGGNLIGMGASSGVGKTTMSIAYILPAVVKYDLQAVFIINEQDQNNFKEEALCWYCSNVLDHPVPKRILKGGNFDDETKSVLYKAADWFENEKEKQNITIIPLERYTAKTVVKLLKRFTALEYDIICLDTLKESSDSRDKESWKSLMTDCVDFYDCIKHTNTCMIITYQLVKNKSKYLTSSDIGVSKGILDVFSLNLLFRRPLQTEFPGERDELRCYYYPSENKGTKLPVPLNKSKHYMITFINKNRNGQSDIQLISEADFSINKYQDLGYAAVIQEW